MSKIRYFAWIIESLSFSLITVCATVEGSHIFHGNTVLWRAYNNTGVVLVICFVARKGAGINVIFLPVNAMVTTTEKVRGCVKNLAKAKNTWGIYTTVTFTCTKQHLFTPMVVKKGLPNTAAVRTRNRKLRRWRTNRKLRRGQHLIVVLI